MKWLKSWMTMKRIGYAFTDAVSGEGVHYYIDCYGQKWMAGFSRWGFRVKSST